MNKILSMIVFALLVVLVVADYSEAGCRRRARRRCRGSKASCCAPVKKCCPTPCSSTPCCPTQSCGQTEVITIQACCEASVTVSGDESEAPAEASESEKQADPQSPSDSVQSPSDVAPAAGEEQAPSAEATDPAAPSSQKPE